LANRPLPFLLFLTLELTPLRFLVLPPAFLAPPIQCTFILTVRTSTLFLKTDPHSSLTSSSSIPESFFYASRPLPCSLFFCTTPPPLTHPSWPPFPKFSGLPSFLRLQYDKQSSFLSQHVLPSPRLLFGRYFFALPLSRFSPLDFIFVSYPYSRPLITRRFIFPLSRVLSYRRLLWSFPPLFCNSGTR